MIQRLLLLLLISPIAAAAQNTSQSGIWTVRPEWVRAHEEFLASDVLAGRGSATRDEEIAASYVASQFLGYGLKPAPGMQGFIQAAEIVAPRLDGHATLTLGALTLREGEDFTLLISSGRDASGPLRKASDAKAIGSTETPSALLVQVPAGKKTLPAMNPYSRVSSAMVLVPADETTAAMYISFGGKTHTTVALQESPAGRVRPNFVALTPAAYGKLQAEKEGAAVALQVHVLPEEKPRQTFNAIGYLQGTDPASGTMLLTAHLDHLGVGKPVDGDSIYNGANDDAAGTTAVLELAHALAAGPRPRRSILFVCYGSEEAGELGSTYFGAHPPVPLTQLVANLEFEMIGNQDPKMPKGTLLLTGWERSNLGPTLKAHGALLGPDPYPEQHFFERSDNYALALKGVVAHTAAGWGTPPTYHQPSDDLAHLDLAFMTTAIQSLVEPVRWLASSDFKPEWTRDGQPKP